MKYYAVKTGRQSGVYRNWSDCASQVKGYPGNKYKSFNSKAEAEAYIGAGHPRTGTGGGGSSANRPSRAAARAKPAHPATQTLGAVAQPQPGSVVNIYTDGACSNNQARKQGRSKAGYGVYYGPGDPRNHSGRVAGEQTNNRGELQGIVHALQTSLGECKSGKSKHFVIHTDSKYSIDAITAWSKKWEQNNWKSSTGSDVLNKDLIQASRKLIGEIEQHSGKVDFSKVKGHSGHPGNDMADRLAVDGCEKELR